MEINAALTRLIGGDNLNSDQTQNLLLQIMRGEMTPAQVGGLLVALACKGVCSEEIMGGAQALRALVEPVQLADAEQAIDTCGTGGDNQGLFNVSTASAFVVAAAGGKVAKHGNKAASGASGSADVLQAAGAEIMLEPKQLVELYQQCGLCFMFAPLHHKALKNVATIRRELGVRTLLNMLGPLANPASVGRQIVGIFDPELLLDYAQVLYRLGAKHSLVLHSEDGLDELSVVAPTACVEINDARLSSYSLHPRDFGLQRESLDDLRVTDAEHSLQLLRAALSCEHEGASAIVQFNAGAALYVAGQAADIAAGVALAGARMRDGVASALFERYVALSRQV